MKNNQQKEIASRKKETLISLAVILAALVMAFLVSLFVLSLGTVAGDSMKGTLNDGDIIAILKIRDSYDVGDVVVFKKPELVRGPIVKRVAAVEGDRVVIGKDGGFWVNSELVEVFPEGSFTPIDVVLGQGELFVLGDNREASVDSRDPDFPVVYEKDVVGVVTYRLFPKIEKIG